MNFRKYIYFSLVRSRGQALGANYKQFLQSTQDGISNDISKKALVRLLTHCRQFVPYYAEIMEKRGASYEEDPVDYLRSFPVLTKETIRGNFDALKSSDLSSRKWYFNTTGGSTGEPVRFIQDQDYAARSGAISLLFSKVAADKEIGESEIMLWGSERDITGTKLGLKAGFVTALTNTTVLSVFRLDPGITYKYINIINHRKPKLIVGYASALYEIAKFAENNKLQISPQHAIITSAVTLYPYMRDAIERVFQCKVFDRYGSREVGDIACERPGYDGLWVAPWGNYIEIVDNDNNPVENGVKGEILVTSMSNFAMPLIRYRIGDRGTLSSLSSCNNQVLKNILGRSYDAFVNNKGIVIEGGYFMALLYFRDWISKYQVIQKSPKCILFKIVRSGTGYLPGELDDVSAKAKRIMGDDSCNILFEFVDDIPASNSGKFRFIVSEVLR